MKIFLLGDIALNGSISENVSDIQHKFQAVSRLLSKGELAICNLETPVQSSGSSDEVQDHFRYTSSAALINAIDTLNINLVTLANNHIFDLGEIGLEETISILKHRNIYYTGAGRESIDPAYLIFELNQCRIAILSYNHPSTNPSLPANNRYFLNTYDRELVCKKIEQICLNHRPDLLIVSLHWGKDYSNYYEAWQSNDARMMIDSGANIIMGHHAHTIQPVEHYKEGLIFYSLGNLCFGDFLYEGKMRSLRKKTKLGMIAEINSNGKLVQLIPTRELAGNDIIIPEINLAGKLNLLSWINRLMHKSRLIKYLVKVKESVLDRIKEFFTGYYRHPLKDIFSMKNLSKIKFIFRDLKQI